MPPDRRATARQRSGAVSRQEGLDALLVTHLPNVRYLTGFTGSAALLVVHAEATVLVTDFRYAVQAPAEAGQAAVVEVDQKSVWERLAGCSATWLTGSLGIESHALTVRDAERIGELTRARVVPTAEQVERLRAIKSPEEVAAIRAAAELAQEALAEVLPGVRRGQSEREIGAALEGALRRRGSEWHPVPDDRRLGPSERLASRAHQRPDGRPRGVAAARFGAQVDGYCADLTRTVVVGGRADDRQRIATSWSGAPGSARSNTCARA